MFSRFATIIMSDDSKGIYWPPTHDIEFICEVIKYDI